MPLPTIYRSIIIASLVLTALTVFASITLVGTLPMPLQDYLANDQAETSAFMGIVAIVFLILIVVNTIGLWKYKNWARIMYLSLTVIAFLFYPYFGPVLLNVWEALFTDIGLLLEGMLIVLMYTGEVHERFLQKPTQETPQA